MRGMRKSNMISWAPDVSLCQIKLFLTEEPPSQVGLSTQDHLQAKTYSASHLNGAAADDFLPPGFEGAQSHHMHVNLPENPVIKWRCPHRFALDFNWQVVAGEESKEVETQNQREVRVLEAVYPRPSSIPTSPCVSADIENCHYDDHLTPQIPITPIEDEDTAIETLSDVLAPFGAPISSQPSVSSASAEESPSTGMVLNVESGVAAATTAALRATNQSNECGNMIDPDLLVKIISNPQLIEKLVTDYGAASGAQNLPRSASPLVPSSYPYPHVNISDPSPSTNRIENGIASMETTSSGAHYAESNRVGVGPSNKQGPIPSVHPASLSPASEFPQKKDVNYYKNLIQQHGGERRGPSQNLNYRYNQLPRPNQQPTNNPKARDLKPRVMKTCSYFNSARGCRNGANCAFQHIISSQNRVSNNSDVPNAKRIKMDERDKQFENTSVPFFT
ncbi:zinc finger CCCH domain-containing protein 6-like [Hibiscus syriacus]|uniref:zinc finger CCCH domain-containing protein 6-like n=1 Tax=Hibiscus syriacus TaxID=106335 RepID=UPI001923341D|nr:zinc finger CCCH domain-containing protein 6-like [Hibiscus syriacus]